MKSLTEGGAPITAKDPVKRMDDMFDIAALVFILYSALTTLALIRSAWLFKVLENLI